MSRASESMKYASLSPILGRISPPLNDESPLNELLILEYCR